MNKIVLSNDTIKLNLDNNITCEYSNEDIIKKLTIKILNSSKLELEIKEDIKLDMICELASNINCEFLEIKKGNKSKIQAKYILKENSNLNLIKLHALSTIFERDIVNLKGINSSVNYVLKTVSTEKEKYDLTVNHLEKNTKSNVINNGVNYGNLEFNVTSVVGKNIKNCKLNQTNRIINFTDNVCTIRPIMLIDEKDVEANHSALIGPFTLDEYFYIERLGISVDLASKLLLEGFIKSNCSYLKQVTKLYENYWR